MHGVVMWVHDRSIFIGLTVLSMQPAVQACVACAGMYGVVMWCMTAASSHVYNAQRASMQPGVQACCVVMCVHDRSIHTVLTVPSRQPGVEVCVVL